jgi:prevent-host-death family protein
LKLETMAKLQAKQLVVCVDNEGYSASLEKRKIYVALRDAVAEKHGLLRIVDESGEDLPLSENVLSPDRLAAVRQEGGIGRGIAHSSGDHPRIGGRDMARTVRKSGMKEVPLSEIKGDLSRFLREAETQEIVITRHDKPAGVLIGFQSEEDWLDRHIRERSGAT